jgi:hypothetical protein
MAHPLTRLPARRAWLISLVAATAVLTVVLQAVGPADPDIVAFEFAGTTERAAEIVAGWSDTDQLRAAFSLGLDYLYLAVYSTTIALACAVAACETDRRPWRRIGVALAWAAWLAAAFDAVENMALWRTLIGPVTAPFPQLAAICAVAKFTLVILGITYAVATAIAFLASGRRAGSPQG